MRSNSIRQLHALLVHWTCIHHIHCYGVEEAGVLEAIKEELATLQEDDPSSMYVVVNCFLSNGSLKLLIDEIIRELNLSHHGKVDTVDAFANFLGSHLFSTKTRIKLTIVLDQVQLLSSFQTSAVKTLLSLPKSMSIIGRHIGEEPLVRFVTHSEIPWDRIGMLNTVSTPVSIGFENLSEEECVDLLTGVLAKDGINRKVVEYIVRIACDKYSKKYGDISEIKSMKLLPILEALSLSIVVELYFDNFGVDTPLFQNETDCFWRDESARDAPINLPISAKYLLIASFCASHNPPATDKRYFVMFHGREKRSEARERRAEQAAEQRDIEAKTAELQRIKCIYLALTNLYPVKDINMDIDVNPQIATLCGSGLLARTTSPSNLDQPKFRCMLSFENVNEIAQ
uniref:ORC4_C domain-containing protein n=1 Tax=Angiostrongylus cantonensis TaxID=6313 RepID=A0A158PBD5_ANGCA